MIAVPAVAQPTHPQSQVPDPEPDVPPPSTTDPTEPAPAPPATSTSTTPPPTAPPIVTISTMPVSKQIPGGWDDKPRTAAWIATGVGGATLAAAIGWYFYHDRYTHVDKPPTDDMPCIPSYDSRGHDIHNCSAPHVGETTRQQHKQNIWFGTEVGLCVATGATMLVSAYLWSRHYTPARHILVSPTTNGATVSLGGSF